MDSVALLRTLVGFDTVSRHSNLALIDWAADLLDSHGARIRLTHDDDRRKANLLASFGPDTDGGVLLSAHTDVVPVDGQDWSGDPFTLAERDGRLYGRGAADMKGFIACCLAAVPAWSAGDLARPIHLALSYDEEVGCLGVPRLIADMAGNVPAPALAIVGEPTGMRAGHMHHGAFGFRTEFTGRAAHSSDPAAGISAIGAAAGLVRYLESAAADGDGPRSAYNIGRVAGGSAINIVSSCCEVEWMFRPAPDADSAAIRGRIDGFLAERSNGAAASTTELFAVPGFLSPPEGPAVRAAGELGAELPATGLHFGTEAGHFQAAGIPAVVCGPGSIEQAHQPDEWIAPSELRKADRMMAAVGDWARA